MEDWDSPDPEDLCRGCATPLSPDRRLGTIYCSKACCQAHARRLDKEARAAARAGRTCQECGRKFDAVKADQMYCSRACSRLAMRKKTWGYRNCQICDRRFLPTGKHQFMCVAPPRFMECVERLKARIPKGA